MKFKAGCTVQHCKSGGLYEILFDPSLAILEATGKAAYIYQSKQGLVFARDREHMESEGRFIEVDAPSETSFGFDKILGEVANERVRQISKWGHKVDKIYSPLDWHEMISDYNGWARRMAAMGSPHKARTRYIQVAALAIAAVEALDARIDKALEV